MHMSYQPPPMDSYVITRSFPRGRPTRTLAPGMSAPEARIGDYVIEAELGTGGMATVYRVRHAFLESRWALKVLDPGFRDRAEARRRFLDEAKIQHTHLDHPNIVKVTGIVATAEHAALVMELIEGGSLEQELFDATATTR